jgi:hypothetical protein
MGLIQNPHLIHLQNFQTPNFRLYFDLHLKKDFIFYGTGSQSSNEMVSGMLLGSTGFENNQMKGSI